MRVLLALVACLVQSTLGFYNLKLLSYTQLATGTNNAVPEYNGLDLGTAIDATYDFVNNIIYVIDATNRTESHLMHVVDIADPSNPTVLFVHQFTKGEGIPRAIDVCGDEIAVALADPYSNANQGHVRMYRTYTKGSGATEVVLHGYTTVGNSPKSLKYTPDCHQILITNEGGAGRDGFNDYQNPEGSVTIINDERYGNPSVRRADFHNTAIAASLDTLRYPSLYIPNNLVHSPTTQHQDLEPEDVAISSDGRTAWVTLQENDAIAEISLSTGLITKVTRMPKKNWDASAVDCSDKDGGVHRHMYDGLYSIRQPGVIKSFAIGKKQFLFTGDEGAITSYTDADHGFTWTDATNGASLQPKIDPTYPGLDVKAGDDEQLGRLQVSNFDGKNQFDMFTHLEMFGGRGFSVWSSTDLSTPVYDSMGTLEQYMEASHKNVFNTDYLPDGSESPENLRDSVSNKQGAQVTALDIKEDNGTVFLVVGTWSTGTLYLYIVNTTSGQPIPSFQSVVRHGVQDSPWKDLYTNKEVGDLYITKTGIIPSDHSPIDSPLLYVTSTGSGSLSVYSIEKQSPGIPDPVLP